MENNQRSAKCLMKNDVCHWQSSHLQEVFLEPDCAVFHLDTCFMCSEWKCIKSHSLQEIKGHVTPHSWMFQSQSNLIQCLDLFQWALNSPLMDVAEPSLQKGQLLWEYWSTKSVHVSIVPLYDVVDPLGCFWQCGSFWEKSGSLPCLVCPRRSLRPGGESICFPTGRALFFPALPQKCSLGPSRLSLEGLKVLQKPSKGYKSKLWWKPEVASVCLDGKFHAGHQYHVELISWPSFQTLVSMA